MKKYENPTLKLIGFAAADVITLSLGADGEDENSIIHVDLGEH